MQARLTAAFLASAALFAPLAAAPPATPAATAPITVPPLAFRARTLPNGLRVYELPDAKGTTVSVQVWYDVGSKNDPRGRSGFAHLFEHLMFKATRDMPAETMDRLTEDVGGANNASTDDDFTEFHETAPANHLERLIWAEGERMGSLVVDQANFVSERDVVKEELRSDFARPYGELFYRYLGAANYRVSPYARPTIGNIAELDAASLDDVRAFHALYYRPDNAVMVVSGNFDPKTLDGWLDRYMAPIARPAWPIPRIDAVEPPRDRATRYTVTAPNTPLPAVAISWLAPPATDADHAVIEMINGLLSSGESSRLYQALIYRDQLASQVDISADFKRSTGTITAFMIVAGGKDVGQAEAALRREIGRLRDAPVGDAELTRIKNQVVTTALKQRETAEGRASLIASGAIVEGDPSASDRRLAAFQAVTAADVQRVARTLLADDRAVTITYLPTPTPAQAPAAAAPAPAIALAPTVLSRPLVPPPSIPIVTALPPDARMQPPAPGAAIAPVLPRPVARRLANGLRLVVLERHDLPIVTAHLVAGRGTASDPAGRTGLASLTADVLTKGTPSRSAPEVVGAIESLGGSIGAAATRDGASLTLTVKTDALPQAMAVFADVALHPQFAPAEIDRARAQALDGLSLAYQTPGTLASLVATKALFGDEPYGKPTDGTPAGLRAIGHADMAAAYGATWRPETTTLVIAGDVTPDAAQALAERLFGGWRAAPGGAAPTPVALPLPAPRTIVIDMPSAPQAAVTIARPAITRADPLYYPAVVANATLGGGYSARLNQEIRIRRGLAYGAGSSLRSGRLPGELSAATQTKNPSVPQVIDIMQAEMRRLGAQPVAPEELAARKATLIGNFGSTIETTDGLAGVAAGLVIQNVDPAEIGRYAASVEGVTSGQVMTAARTLIDPAPASIVAVGDAQQFLPALQAKGIRPIVIPADSVDLDRAGLRKPAATGGAASGGAASGG